MLPQELWTLILLKCRIVDLLNLQLSCKMFNEIICNNYFRSNYKNINMSDKELINLFRKYKYEYGSNRENSIYEMFRLNDVIIIRLIFEILKPIYTDTPIFLDKDGINLGEKFLENYKIWPLKIIDCKELPYKFNVEWKLKSLYSNADPFSYRIARGYLSLSYGGMIKLDLNKIDLLNI